MEKSLYVRLGNFLYQHFFGLYNLLYKIFKNRQDAFLIELEKNIIKKGDTVLDIGANIGFYSRLFSKMVGSTGKVYAFEPDKINYKHLLQNTSGLKNIELFNKAVSDKTGSINIYTSKELNVDHRTYPVEDYQDVIQIDAVALDEIEFHKKIDFIKIDIQGAELLAFKGMQKILSENPDIKIIAELWPHGLHAAGTSVKEFTDFIKFLGFNIYEIENNNLKSFEWNNIEKWETLPKEKYSNILISRNPVNFSSL